MILFEKQGDIFETTLQTLVCPVNTVGVMGKGLAKAFKERYPGLAWDYAKACRTGVFVRDGFFVWDVADDDKVLCLPSKQHWKNPSKLMWIDEALRRIAANYEEHEIRSLAIPPVGCGEGGLNWQDVRGLIYSHFEHHPLEVGIFTP